MAIFNDLLGKKFSVMSQGYGGAPKPPSPTAAYGSPLPIQAPPAAPGRASVPAPPVNPTRASVLAPPVDPARASVMAPGSPGPVMAPRYTGPGAAPLDPGKVGPETPIPSFGKGGLFGDVPVGGSGTVGSFTARNAGPGMPTVISGQGGDDSLYQMSLLRGGGMSAEDAAKSVMYAGQSAEQRATAGNLTAKRPYIGAESLAGIGLTQSQAQQAAANAELLRTQSSLAPGIAGAENFERRAQGGLYNAQGADIALTTEGDRARLNTLPLETDAEATDRANRLTRQYNSRLGGLGMISGLGVLPGLSPRQPIR